MTRWHPGMLLLAATMGCSSGPTAPSSVPVPPAGLPSGPHAGRWSGTLAREAETAVLEIVLDVRVIGAIALVGGRFTAAYPGHADTGSVTGVIANDRWTGTLSPDAARVCAREGPIGAGSTAVDLQLSEHRMTGRAILVGCDGSTVWEASLVRR